MRWTFILAFVALTACASSTTKTVETGDGASVEVLLMNVVSERCDIPELETYFSFDSADLAGAQRNLDLLAQCLVDGPLRGERILLVGHTDARGEAGYNKQLGLNRARRVGAYLEKQGVPKAHLEYDSKGETGASPEGSERDRRVDINIIL